MDSFYVLTVHQDDWILKFAIEMSLVGLKWGMQIYQAISGSRDISTTRPFLSDHSGAPFSFC